MTGTAVTLNTGSTVTAIAPADFRAVLEFSDLIFHSGLAPSTIKTKDAIAVALLHGMELGFTPMAALQSIAVINGRPSVWGDGALALCQASGLMEDFEESFEGESDNLRAICKAKRKGRTKATISEFSVADAKTAGLWGKAGPWQQHPKRMLKARARAFCLRDAFPDVFRGLAIAEEQQDIDVTAPRPAGPPAPKGADTAPAPTDAEFVEVKTETKPKAAPKPRAPKPEPEKVEVQEAGKPEFDQAAQDEAERREMIEAAGQVYEDDGSTGDPIDAGEVEDAEIEDEGDAPSLQDLIERAQELNSRNLPVAVYMSEFNSIAQQTSTFEDFQELYKARRPHNNDKAIVDGHKVIAAAQKARLVPQEDAGQSGTADVTGLNQNIQGTIPWNGPTDYEKRVRAAIDEAKKAWEAKKSSETESAIYEIADDIKLKFESKVLGDKLRLDLNEVLGNIIEQF